MGGPAAKLDAKNVPLRILFRGPGVSHGRVALADLAKVGRQLQISVERVALVLSRGARNQASRSPKQMREDCALDVVAFASGSFDLGLDFRHDQSSLLGTGTGEVALEKLIAGIAEVASSRETLPVGYDEGVLDAWRKAGAVLNRGIETIHFALRVPQKQIDAAYDAQVHRRVVQRIRPPAHNQRTVEGRLMVTDFRKSHLTCRLYPPVGSTVLCAFDETLEEDVYENIRAMVRVTGKAEEDPNTNRIQRLHLVDIEPLNIQPERPPGVHADFWRQPILAEPARPAIKTEQRDAANEKRLLMRRSLLAAFEADPVEDGISHSAEKIIEKALKTMAAEPVLEWLRDFSLDAENPGFSASVLRCLGRQSALGSLSWRMSLIRDGLAFDSVEIRDAAVQTAESWGEPEMVSILAGHSEKKPWLREYIRDVIVDSRGLI